MRFYWVRDRVIQNHIRVFWEEGKKNMADYFTKIPPYLAPQKNASNDIKIHSEIHRKFKRLVN